MAAHDDDDGSGKTVRRRVPVTDAPRAAEPFLEPTTVRGSVPPAAEPVVEHTVVRAITSDGDPLIGAMLGEYRVLAPLGTGGMGLVYRGEQPVIGRPVAIKVLKREFAQDPQHARRFLEEARSVSAARHPGIIDVFSFGETVAGEPYLVMELLEGEPLDALIKRRGTLPAKEAIALLVPILNALSAAHAAGVIHRDLKPGNIFVVKLADGTTFPKLLDFGLARRGEAGSRVRQTSVGGTPLYIAPEQARGEAVGPQTDLYSLGCVIYELLVGRPPFTAVHLHELLDQHRTLAPQPLRAQTQSIPPGLERLVLQLLEKDPAKRPASALEVREQLERLQHAKVPHKAPELTTAETFAPTSPELPMQRRSPRWPLVGGLVVAGLVVSIGVRVATLHPEAEPPPVAGPVPIQPVPIQPVPSPPEPEPEPTPEPVVVVEPEKPRVPVEPAKVPPPKPVVKQPKHTAGEVRRKLRALRQESRSLPDDLRRAAALQLEEARYCTASPDQCWRDLAEIEKTFFRK